MESDFRERKKLAVNREKALFSVLDNIEETQRREALQFLFAYMPLSDLADYSGEFFLANSDAALKARSETSWGNSIPEDIFLHYVLPYRVNNENPDSFRIVFYDEIMEMVRGLSMKNAALEINHWCHEKVACQPADIRTSAPMSTVLSALSFFKLAPGEHLGLKIRLRKNNTEKGSVPLIDTRKLEQLLKAEPGSIRDGKGVLMAVIEPDMEPSVHLIKELCLISRELKTWGGSLVIMVSGGSEFDPSFYEGFPQNPLILNTGKGNVIQNLFLPGPVPEFIWPLVLLTDTKGSVVFHSSGYRIGTGDQIIRHLLKK